jgi:DNA-binding NarL/FixJ family response regulator
MTKTVIPKEIRLMIADDHEIIIKGIQLLIKNEFPITKIHECNSIERLLREIELFQPSHLILDVTFPENSSTHYIEEIFHISPNLKILLFTMHPSLLFNTLLETYPNIHFCQKNEKENQLVNKLNFFFYDPRQPNSHKKQKSTAPKGIQLSIKEEIVAKMMIEGKSTNEIALIMGIKSNTVSTYKRRIFDKTDTQNIIQLSQLFKK